jgi:hypothetical protein
VHGEGRPRRPSVSTEDLKDNTDAHARETSRVTVDERHGLSHMTRKLASTRLSQNSLCWIGSIAHRLTPAEMKETVAAWCLIRQ